jgi:hypothetical protein
MGIEERLRKLEGKRPREVPELTQERFEGVFKRCFPDSVGMIPTTKEEEARSSYQADNLNESEKYLTSLFDSFRQPGGMFRKGEH